MHVLDWREEGWDLTESCEAKTFVHDLSNWTDCNMQLPYDGSKENNSSVKKGLFKFEN